MPDRLTYLQGACLLPELPHPLSQARLVIHMTVGKLRTTTRLNEAYDSVKENNIVFKSKITKISVEVIGENEESIIVIEKELI